ncbi:hypothetical protein [Arthrobacter oryzae]|uniref:hypothetical protein n=1 Tax=Arthrobacter oryzae TaxID=409290 RepID=UPI0028640EE2|nr:hypothetical protein [Arthrobacter oryzae]MDR6507339.1 hypothetical protein [Arthrobacter oryzae]
MPLTDHTSELDPLLYPWDPPEVSGVMDGDGFLPLEPTAGLDRALAEADVAPLGSRSVVVSIGSNSSPAVMRRKFASYHRPVSPVLPLVRGRLHNIAVGHSAHVSRAGYIAAAPYPLTGTCIPVWVSWLDSRQLLAVEQTEPNYRRIRLDAEACPLELGQGEYPEDYSLFTSRWGVLTDDGGGKLPFLDQPALFEMLAGLGAGSGPGVSARVSAEIGAGNRAGNPVEECISVFAGPPEQVIERLGMPSVQAWAKDWFSSVGLAAPVDFNRLCAE